MHEPEIDVRDRRKTPMPISRVERAAKRLPGARLSPSSNRAGGFPAHGFPNILHRFAYTAVLTWFIA